MRRHPYRNGSFLRPPEKVLFVTISLRQQGDDWLALRGLQQTEQWRGELFLASALSN